jgi:Transcription factor WhiB
MTIMTGPVPRVTELPVSELSRLVTAATRRPCAQPGADPEDWFPEVQASSRGRERYEFTARALCRFCPVELLCLELALRQEGPQPGHGIAGGTAPWQRQAIKASRGLAARRG